uniref:Uncharacterized protein n=1 Tax=Plectus sambesii TaxID=2011161 RepID=A0A914XGL7_9BILA
MATRKAVYPSLPLDDTLLNRVVSNAKDWALCHGFVTRPREHADKSDSCSHAHFMLLPSKVPRGIFEQATNVQKDMNLLYFLVSWDYDFVNESLREFAKVDEFTRRLLQIYTTIYEEGINQKTVIQLQRSDYICHSTVKGVQLKQVKVNVMPADGGSMGDLCTKMHTDIFRVLGFAKKETERLVPKNNSTATHAAALFRAWYGLFSTWAVFARTSCRF